MAAHDHHPDVQVLADVDSGRDQTSTAFERLLTVRPPFRISCAGCCATYLKTRFYDLRITDDAHVAYGVNPTVLCGVDGPRPPRGMCGLVWTDSDPDLVKSIRPVCNSISYQFYQANAAPLGSRLGANLVARIEAIAVKKVRRRHLEGCYFSYCAAALLEFERASRGVESLRGVVSVPSVRPAISGAPSDPPAPSTVSVKEELPNPPRAADTISQGGMAVDQNPLQVALPKIDPEAADHHCSIPSPLDSMTNLRHALADDYDDYDQEDPMDRLLRAEREERREEKRQEIREEKRERHRKRRRENGQETDPEAQSGDYSSSDSEFGSEVLLSDENDELVSDSVSEDSEN
eukprot:TRINITY_DN2510_c0_g1::TRINITY_DN2510_c0_g1_i1::g.19211::m.19211 TRINITY_DN2510_c0_g1::TRINITY_DN2510_c0_g1_i1::g.19211  ORF type:complete len:361 (+),score=12.43 TRINITY_DN2510_c0_g1_i1:40-1083(+)